MVRDAELEDAVADLAARLTRGPAAALARTKRLLAASTAPALEAHLEAEAAAFAEGVVGPEFAEGVRAFVDKRAPRW